MYNIAFLILYPTILHTPHHLHTHVTYSHFCCYFGLGSRRLTESTSGRPRGKVSKLYISYRMILVHNYMLFVVIYILGLFSHVLVMLRPVLSCFFGEFHNSRWHASISSFIADSYLQSFVIFLCDYILQSFIHNMSSVICWYHTVLSSFVLLSGCVRLCWKKHLIGHNALNVWHSFIHSILII